MVLTSAIGQVIVIMPCPATGKWHLFTFNRNAKWQAGTTYETKAEAKQARSAMFKYHRKLARELAT